MTYAEQLGDTAKKMSRYVAGLSNLEKNDILHAAAQALVANTAYLLEENQKDLVTLSDDRTAFKDRLLLTQARVEAMATGLKKIAQQNDPTSETLYMKKLDNGLNIGERRVPLGVVAIIYESRPNVTVDSFGLCIKSGNASILRGGSEAFNSNNALITVLQNTLEKLGHPRELTQLVTDTSREVATQLMKLNQFIDVFIPRGGRGLIQSTIQHATVPTIETGIGNCHIYIDEAADMKKALAILINAKTSRISVCNSVEKLLLHQNRLDQLPSLLEALDQAGVEIRGDKQVTQIFAKAKPATEEDWYEEYLDMIIGVKIVDDLNHAIAHINHYGSSHSEAIVTENYTHANQFTDQVDAAAVYVNASTRFTDGEEFGLGAEIGISTQKLHARGPMGLTALTTTKFIVFGNGQIRS